MSSKVPTKVFIGNLTESCSKINLQRLFESYGEVVECDIIRNYGFVHFADADEARIAVDNLDGLDFEGTTLKVELSHSKVRQRPGMGRKGDCYRCGNEGHWSKDCPKGPSRPPRPPRREDPYARPAYRDPYYRAPYPDPYFRERYPPPPPIDRYRYADPYSRHPLPPLRDPYYRDRDLYDRPPPEYYGRRSPPPYPRYEDPLDPYYDYYARERAYPPPPPLKTSRASPSVARVPAPY